MCSEDKSKNSKKGQDFIKINNQYYKDRCTTHDWRDTGKNKFCQLSVLCKINKYHKKSFLNTSIATIKIFLSSHVWIPKKGNKACKLWLPMSNKLALNLGSPVVPFFLALAHCFSRYPKTDWIVLYQPHYLDRMDDLLPAAWHRTPVFGHPSLKDSTAYSRKLYRTMVRSREFRQRISN